MSLEKDEGFLEAPQVSGDCAIAIALPRERRILHPLTRVSVSLGLLVTSLLILKLAPVPFFWLYLAWAAVLFGAMFFVRGDWPRAILLNIGILLCMFAGVEAYFVRYEYTPPTISPGFNVHDEVLGWAPAKSSRGYSMEPGPRGVFHGPRQSVFDVTYTIDSNGLRIAPPWRKEDLLGTVLFFGCSYTFGLGLNDDQTLPYQFSAQSGGRYRTINFAFNGYSSAEMLAAIEHGKVRQIVDAPPKYAFYAAIPHHVWRVAGKISWGGSEPRYVMEPDGRIQQAGFFRDRQPHAQSVGLAQKISAQLNKSATWRIFTTSDSRITEDDIRLYLATVRRSQELLEAEYPGIQFKVILWPNAGAHETTLQRNTYNELQAGFNRLGIPVLRAEDILPNFKANESKFTLSAVDPHPNALANRLLANYLLNEIGK